MAASNKGGTLFQVHVPAKDARELRERLTVYKAELSLRLRRRVTNIEALTTLLDGAGAGKAAGRGK